MKLYEISAAFEAAVAEWNPDDLDFLEKIDELNINFIEKAAATVAYALNLEAEAESIKLHCEKLTAKRRRREAQAADLKNYVLREMWRVGLREISDPSGLFTAKIRQTPPAVVVDDAAAVPEQFKIVETAEKIDKRAILTALKAGETVSGCRLEHGERLAVG